MDPGGCVCDPGFDMELLDADLDLDAELDLGLEYTDTSISTSTIMEAAFGRLHDSGAGAALLWNPYWWMLTLMLPCTP